VTLDPTAQTAICDAPPNALDPGAGESKISCTDAIIDGVRALSADLRAEISHVRVTAQRCAVERCTTTELSTSTVIAWTTTNEAWSTVIEVGLPEGSGVWASPAVRETKPSWPSLEAKTPAIRRPTIDGAPSIVAGRPPYPFCGTIEPFGGGDAAKGWSCFLAAVLAGRPAELLEHAVSGGGDPLVMVYRYSGAGAVVRFSGAGGKWNRANGSIILPPPGTTVWSYEPWPDSPTPL
jgi:hypothetical protein